MEGLGRVAVLIPCYNEAATVADVVRAFRRELPGAAIWVYDNNSSDGTDEEARRAGALVGYAKYQGKGNTVRRMFADVEADTYILVDGDGTYDAPSVGKLLEAYISYGADMVNGARVTDQTNAYRPGHRFGNWLLSSLVGLIFGREFRDLLSGYRVFSRRFAKSFAAHSRGFEIETELTIHALELRMPAVEIDTPYHARPEGSESKLSTLGDGWRILRTLAKLVKDERPLPLFLSFFALLSFISVALAIPLFVTYIETGLVPRFPTAILSAGLMVLAFLSLACGLILDTVTRGRQEVKQMRYLSLPGPCRGGFAGDAGTRSAGP